MMPSVRTFGSPNGATDPAALLSFQTKDNFQHQIEVLRREVNKNPAFMDSVALQTRWRGGYPVYNLEQKLDQKSKLLDLRANSWREISDFIYYYRNHFEATVERELDNYDFYYGYQWDDAEIKRLQKIFMVPHVANHMTRWIRTLLGEKRGSETQFFFESEDDSLKPVTELYNQVCGKISRANEWSDRSSDAFANLAIAGRCFMSVRPDPNQPFTKILMQNERYQEFMYDFEHAKDGTLDGCNYLMRTYYKDLEEVIFQYPEWEDYLLNYDYAASSGIEQLLLFTIARPKVPPTAYKRVVQTPQQFQQRPFFQRRRVAWMTEFYRLQGIKQWTVRDGNFNIEYDFDAPDQAASFYRDLRDASIARNIALTGQPGLDLVIEPTRITRKVLNTETWCSNVLLDVQTTRVGRFPYIPMHNEFHDGQWRGHFEDDKPNQKLENKLLVMLDMSLGGLKGKSFYHEDLFSKESTENTRQEMLRDPMKAIIGKWDKNSDPRALHFNVNPTGIDGAVLKELMGFISNASNFINGGLNMVGDAEFAGQSAKSTRTLQQSAQTGTVDIFSNMKRAEKRVGQHLVYTAQNLHPTVLLEYANKEDREKFVPLLQTMSHSVDMDQITMEVQEVLSGPTRSNQQAAELLEVAGQDPAMLQSIMPEVMRLRRFPSVMVDRIESAMQSVSEAQSQQAQAEFQQAQEMQQHKIEAGNAKIQLEAERVEIEKHPPVAFSLSGKVNAPGPDAMASIYNQHGIPADPDHVAASEVQQDQKDQVRDNVRQSNFQALDLPYQTKLARLHPTEKKKKSTEGVRSAKDRNNRSRKKAEKSKTQV